MMVWSSAASSMKIWQDSVYILPVQNLKSSCCGMMFNSRGFKKAAADKAYELEESLLEASQGGKLPIVIDTSPCLAQIKGALNTKDLR